MKRRSREFNIFSISALDLFASALGVFIIIAVVLFPFFPTTDLSQGHTNALRKRLQESQARLQQAQAELQRAERELAKVKFPHLDLVIALDTTGSMRKEIEGLKEQLKDLVEVLARLAPSLGFGVVEFKDRHDDPVTSSILLREVSPGSASLDLVQRFVNGLHAGGSRLNTDGPEAVYAGLNEAIAMPWRNTAQKKIIVVVTDNPAYRHEYRKAIDAARLFAGSPGHIVSCVQVRDEPLARQFLEALSSAGQGKFILGGGSMTSSILLALL